MYDLIELKEALGENINQMTDTVLGHLISGSGPAEGCRRYVILNHLHQLAYAVDEIESEDLKNHDH